MRTGADYLESLRDGRVVYVGNERVDDVTEHPAFRAAARTYASLYDLKADPARRDTFSYNEDGNTYSAWFLRPKSREDLERRSIAHRALAEASYGLLGRSPDHQASSITGLAMRPEVFGDFADNISSYYEHIRANDWFGSYAVVPPKSARTVEFGGKSTELNPNAALRVVDEDDEGVIISGQKMLATAAAYADYIWVGNLVPIKGDRSKESITCAVSPGAPGLTMWSRKPLGTAARQFDNPLASRFDEGDFVLLFDRVKVPWEHVFVYDDVERMRSAYTDSPAHVIANHQSNCRFWSKMRLLLASADAVVRANGNEDVPAVQETLGRLAAMEATIGGLVAGQIQDAEEWAGGYTVFNRRYLYAALQFSAQHHSEVCDVVRELSGGGVLQFPADISVTDDPDLATEFERYWGTDEPAVDRMKTFKLVWDVVGSEFASRHVQYEKFYIGPMFMIRRYSFLHAPWGELRQNLEELMASYGVETPGGFAA
jgi:4-hydroxyphenylacetate 3-monooxygenase